MSSSPEPTVLRGAGARDVAVADFDVDLRLALPAPSAAVGQVREAARTTGYADGWAQGQRAARVAAKAAADRLAAVHQAAARDRAAAAERALAAVAKAAADLDARQAPQLAAISDAVLSAAVEIAEALVGYELSSAEAGAPGAKPALAALCRAMSLVRGGGQVTVRLNPDDHRSLLPDGGNTYTFEGRTITVLSDASLARGDATAEYGLTTVDATLAAAVARVRKVLTR